MYKLTELSANIIREHFTSLSEPEWLIELRVSAWKEFEKNQTGFANTGTVPLIPADAEETIEGSCVAGIWNIFSQWDPVGAFIQAPMHWFKPIQKDTTFTFTTMREALKTHETILKKHLSARLDNTTNPIDLLSLALWNNGVFIHLPQGVKLDSPIVILKGLASSPNNTVLIDNNLIVAETDSRAQIFEQGITVRQSPEPSAGGFRIGHTNLVVSGGNIDYISLSSYADSLTDFTNLYTHVFDQGQARVYGITLSGKLVQRRLFTYLEAPHSMAEQYDIYFGDKKEYFNIDSGIIHIAPQTAGKMLARGVLRDTASSMYNGLIRIQPKAQGSNNRLSSNTLLLDKGAHAKAIPSLEILADDIQASHGATLSHVDENQLFYLMSRGITREYARELIVSGFFAPLLDTIENKEIDEYIKNLLQRRMV